MRYILQYIQYTTLLFGHKKGNPAMCNNKDGPRGQVKQAKDRQIACDTFTCGT